MKKNNVRNHALAFFGIWLITSGGAVCAQETGWQDEQRKAIAATAKEPDEAITLYQSALKDAVNAPVEKRLAMLLQYGDLLGMHSHATKAKDVYSQGIDLAHSNDLKNWEARFLLMSSCNAHALFHSKHIADNDPAPVFKALELRPGKPDCPTDFHINCLEAIGDAYIDRKDYSNAEKYLYDALAEAERMPDAQSRYGLIIQSFVKMRIAQKRYADAIILVAATRTNKSAYFDEIDRVDPETSTIEPMVRDLLKKEDFAGLDAYADKLRLTKNSTASGRPAMDFFLDGISLNSNNNDNTFKKRFELFSNWIRARPSSEIAKIGYAETLTSYAWAARGSGWGRSVTDEGWKLMRERLARALETLRQIKQPIHTPEWYKVAQRVALGQGWDRTQYENLMNECHVRFPQYKSIIFGKAYWLQPKWFGNEGEATAYITSEANKMPGLAGDVLYAQCAWSLDFSFENVIKDAKLDWPRTKRGFKEIFRLYPDSLRARSELAYLGEQMGDKEAQLAAFAEQGRVDPRVKLNPPGYESALYEGKQAQYQDDRKTAIDEYTKAIELAPNNGEAYYRRCEMYVLGNRFAEASADIEKCLSMFPEWLPAVTERGRLENLTEKYPESIADLERVLTLQPDDGSSLSTLGHNYDALGNHQRALDIANFCLETSEQSDPRHLYYSYQDRGLTWANAHQYDNAVSDLRKGISLNEKHASQLWAYLAYADAATDRVDQARDDAKRMFELESFAPRGYRLRAEMLRAAGLWDQSIQDYNRSTNSEPTYGPGFWQRAVSEIAIGDYKSAEADLKQSVTLVPTSALAHSYLAFVEDHQGESSESKTAIEKAFALTPDLPMNYVNRALIHLHHGELESAAADCDKALKLDNYLADAYAASALVLAKAGKTDAAAKFNEAAKVQWWHPWKVPLDPSTDSTPADISIAMPTLAELKPQPFSVAIHDCAP